MPIAQSDPPTNDSIDEPKPDQPHGQPRNQDPYSKGRHDEHEAEHNPEQSEPERPDLPSKMRFEPCAAYLASFDIVQNDRDDRRPTGQKRADDGGGADDAGYEAEGMKRVNHLGPGDECI